MNLQNMAPNAQRSLVITIVFALLAGGIYLGLVEPAIARLAATDRALSEAQSRHEIMLRNLNGTDKINQRLESCATNLAPFKAAIMEPLLESLAMRARSLLEPIASGAGLIDTDFTELPRIALPVPKRLPLQLHARLPIRMTARGSFQATVSFLRQVERDLPLVTLQSMLVTVQNDPTSQMIEMVFEWPDRGKTTRPVMPVKGAGR